MPQLKGTGMQQKATHQDSQKHELTSQETHVVAFESGHGMPVLFLHGSPDTHEIWLPVIVHLADHVRCIAMDLPGFGESTLPANFELTLDNMADFVRSVSMELSINEPVTLVTTDFGAHYGLAFVVKYPDLVRGIAISNTNFFHDYHWHIVARLYRVPVLGELLLAMTTKSMLRNTLKKVSPALPDWYIDRSYETSFGSPAVRKTILRMYRARASKDFVGWEDKLRQLLEHKPAIVLWGDQDPFVSPTYADRFGQAEVYHFKEYSHWLPLEAPQQYVDALLPWLRKLKA
jgi:pimeloyl-ACP methyl ester carboxylesterase